MVTQQRPVHVAPPPALAPAPDVASRTPRACANCGTPAPMTYCPACGQAQHALHRSVRSIVADVLDTFAGWDGKIPVTLWLLVRHPGRLTADYAAGRRARHLPPLRLYLSLSAVLVLAFQFAAPRMRGVKINFQDDAAVHVERGPGPARPVARPAVPPTGPWQQLKHTYFGGRITALEGMSEAERQRALTTAFLAKLGTMFFALLPVFALLLGALYFRGPLVYAEHLVFALHVHAFAAGALALALVLPGSGAWRAIPLLWIPAYLAVALRSVYGGSRRRTLVKLALLGGGYFVVLMVAMTLTALLAFLVG